MSPLPPANITKQVPPFRHGFALHGDTDGAAVGRAVGSEVVGSVVVGPRDGDAVGSEVVGSVVVGSDVVGSVVVGPRDGDAVGAEVVGSEVIGVPVGVLDGDKVSSHCTPK
jgi:hypothetical protein